MRVLKTLSRVRWPLVAAGLLVLLLWLAFWVVPAPLPMQAGGCAVLTREGVCQVDDTPEEHYGPGRLRLWLGVQPFESPLVLLDGRRVAVQRVDDQQSRFAPAAVSDATPNAARNEPSLGQRIELQVPPGDHVLRVISHNGWAVHHATLRIADRHSHEPRWLHDARFAWLGNHKDQARALLEAHMQDAVPLAQHALATGLLARVLWEFELYDKSQALLEESLRLDREAGLVSAEADDAMWLARLEATVHQRIARAEALLAEHAESFERYPQYRGIVEMQRTEYRQLRGDLQGALDTLDVADFWIRRFGQPYVLHDAARIRAELLHQTGRLDAARAAIDAINPTLLPPCHEAMAYAERAAIRIVLLESGRDLGDPKTINLDPRWHIQQAIITRQAKCNQNREILDYQLLAVRAHLVVGDLREAQRLLEQIHAAFVAKKDDGRELELLDLDGLVALASGDSASATTSYQALLARAQGVVSIKDSGESLWRGWVGLGRAAELAHDDRAALAAYRHAEAQLDAAAYGLPATPGPGSSATGRDRATGRLARLLVRSGDGTEALRVMRHARVRRFALLANLVHVSRLGDDERARQAELTGQYQKVQQELAALDEKAAIAGVRDQMELASRRAPLRVRQGELLRQMVHNSHRLSLDAEDFREPDPDELLLAGMPTPDGWLFLARSAGAPVEHLLLPAFSPTASRHQLEGWFAPLLPRMATAKRVTLLASSDWVEADFATLQWEGGALGDRRQIAVSLDLPLSQRVTPPTRNASAPMAFGCLATAGTTIGGGFTSGTLHQALENNSWRVELRGDGPSGDWPQRSHALQSSSSEELRELLSHADLFLFLGHGRLHEGALAMGLKFGLRGLSAADALSLDGGVPAIAVLLACGSGLSVENVGGFDSVGFTQALLARGAQAVLGTVRDVDATRMAKLLSEIAPQLTPGANAATLYDILRRARKAAGGPAGEPLSTEVDPQVGALRMFVP